MLKQFYKENKVMVQIFGGSCLVSISYLISNIFPETFMEWFTGADELYSFFSDVSLAIIASVIFYYIQSFIPNYKRNLTIQERVKKSCNKVLYRMVSPISYMAQNYINKGGNEYSDDELWIISRKINFSDKVRILDARTRTYWDTKTLISEYIRQVEEEVDKLIIYWEPYIDEDVIKILDEISESTYISIMKLATQSLMDFSKTPKEGNYLIEYYNLYVKLKKIVDKM